MAAITDSVYLGLLRELVSYNTVSPLSMSSVQVIDDFLGSFGFVRKEGHFWFRSSADFRTCIYGHVDTKPPAPRREWTTNPYELTYSGCRLFGLGVSDSKFQLLNALLVFSNESFIVDGAEEIGSTDVVRFIDTHGIKNLVIIDGGIEKNSIVRVFSGTKGQIDGCIRYNTGKKPIHPGRETRSEILDWFKRLHSEIKSNSLSLNVTGIRSTENIRSLTLEEVEVRFDIRYSEEERELVELFIEKYKPQIRQSYMPLLGKNNMHDYPVATFSSPLGNMTSDADHVLVLPGGLVENGNHKPNEWIYSWQIKEHQKLLTEALATVKQWT